MNETGFFRLSAVSKLDYSKTELKWIINEMVERLGDIGMKTFEAVVAEKLSNILPRKSCNSVMTVLNRDTSSVKKSKKDNFKTDK
jgi:hypothetical protein